MRRASAQPLAFALAVCTVSSIGLRIAFADEAPTCSGDFFHDACRDDSKSPLDLRKSTSDTDGVLFNYSLVVQPAKATLIAAFNTMPGKPLQDRGFRIAEEARAAAIAYVTGGVAETSWSPQVRAVAERLRLMKFRLSDADSTDCLATGDPGIPNAQYRPHEHVVGICPAALKIPSSELAATLAHELGHGVSPCMMSKSLVKYIGANREYGVDMEPTSTNELIQSGEAERVPASLLAEPPAYRPINSCLDAHYRNDYENWLAFSTMRVEQLPRTLSPMWQKRMDAARAATPQRCFEKAEEHFADSFGSFTYDHWATKHELTKKETAVGLHFLINTKCAHDRNPGAVEFKNLHATDSDRIALFLKPAGTAARVGCSQAADSLCSLTLNTYFREENATPSGDSPQGSRTKP